ncbi:LacI family DNA-binding transcriptional regulator [Cypionkella sinensis]|uniref:LacI family DNA-binding transcriptional regulator n=1 Tax=Cypionkella sinensis TaxID=1756043 RepID=A0ABV7J0M6_9RHOB
MAIKPKATIADVARLAGVSTATAGRVLGGYGYTSGSKKDQVMKAAEKLGYRPNALARSLITGKTRTIGVVAGDIRNPFYAFVLRGISNVAEKEGFGLLITNSDEDLQQETRAVDLLVEKQVDGLIVSPCDTRDAAHLRALHASGIPLVLIDRAVEALEVDRVGTANVAAARDAVQRLIQTGHRRIGLIAELVEEAEGGVASFIARAQAGEPVESAALYPSWQRLLGYVQAHLVARVPLDPALVRRAGEYSAQAAEHACLSLLSAENRPTALFTTDGTMSEGAMAAIAKLGLTIPGQLSMIGFDDLDWMAFLPPGITTVAQPRMAMGEAATRMLLEQIAGAEIPPRTLLMPAQLIERGSVGKPAA